MFFRSSSLTIHLILSVILAYAAMVIHTWLTSGFNYPYVLFTPLVSFGAPYLFGTDTRLSALALLGFWLGFFAACSMRANLLRFLLLFGLLFGWYLFAVYVYL